SSDLVFPVSSNYFNNVTLSLPSVKGSRRITLAGLLESFTSREELDSGLSKQTCFAKLPACVCFHIQRTAFDGGFPSKRSERVFFPQILDMSPFSYGSLRARESSSHNSTRGNSMPPEAVIRSPGSEVKSKGAIYLLKAVIQHAGAINSGHYVTYRVNAGGRWFFTSDLYVEEVDFASVLDANPYMLFYEKEIV
ncbi:Ubiquitin carboxylterminal hydrolase 30like, partial [Caligus rogercresseyi]